LTFNGLYGIVSQKMILLNELINCFFVTRKGQKSGEKVIK
jgi:hypothetical protein